ncbi:MAG: hypothetical protein JRI46_05170 [Deltaproteobacteria bacterium]|nr:hypothetical protein [Deltaproteobacteria bacterium]
MKKKWRRRWEAVGEGLTFVFAPAFILLIRLIPLSWVYPLSRTLAQLGRIGLGRRKKIALANLRLVFGKRKDEQEIQAIYQGCLTNTVISFLELLKFCFLPAEVVKKRIEIVGKENLDEALKKGKGIVAISVHLGNFPLICFKLALEGYPFAVIAKNPKNRYLTGLFNHCRDKVGIGFIDGGKRRTAAQGSLQQLRQGGVLLVQLDQNPPYKEIMVDFFGYPVPSFKGPVVLAMRTGASILPTFILADRDWRHKMIIERPFPLEITGDKEQDVARNLALLMKLTEGYIERFPEQWWWWHRRWKRHIDYKHL